MEAMCIDVKKSRYLTILEEWQGKDAIEWGYVGVKFRCFIIGVKAIPSHWQSNGSMKIWYRNR